MNRTYLELLEEVKAEWKCVEETVKVPFYPHVSLGWDNTARFTDVDWEWRCLENTPENIRKGLELARNYVDTPP